MAPLHKYDFVIVGAGPAGLTLAARISAALPDKSVCLLEAGADPSSNPDVHHVAGMGKLSHGDSEQAWNLNIKPNPKLNNRKVIAPVGKGLSGSTAINGGAWTRGPKPDYDLWAEIVGDQSWSYDELLPAFRRTEKDMGEEWKDEVQHGYSGTVAVDPICRTRRFPLREDLRRAWEESGVGYKGDPNSGRPNGVTEALQLWLDGKRQLPHQILRLERATVMENSMVAKVVFDEGASPPTAKGVQLLDGTTISAREEVIISAGVFHTPQILMLSGVGPKSVLQEHSIPLVHDNPHVGAHLKDHLGVTSVWQLQPSAIAKGGSMGHPEFMKHPEFFMGWPMDFIGFFPVASSSLPILDELNSMPADKALITRPNASHIETVVLYMPSSPKHAAFDTLGLPMDGTYISHMDVLLTPTSEGSVSISSADAKDPPVIDVNFNATDSDRFIMREAMRKTAHLLTGTATGKAIVAKEVALPGIKSTSDPDVTDAELDARIAELGVSVDHPMGSCRMAKKEEGSDGGVVDSRCRVFGVKGLRVVDASVFPVPIAAHIQATVYAVGERGAEMIIEDLEEK
jgi:choline dehydrogenase-like flavoprotein